MANNLNVGDWEEEIFSFMCGQAQVLSRLVLEKVDDMLMQRREPGLVVEGFRERRVVTLFGHVMVKRRLYRDESGRRRYLLDEVMGLEKRSPLSHGVKELSTLLASYLPFNKCENLLRVILPAGISHTTVHRELGRVTEPSLNQEKQEVAALFQHGVIPDTEGRKVSCLFVEADGVSIALQREKKRRGEIKVGIAYEGWQEIGHERYRLINKTVYLGLMDGEHFWEGFSLILAKKYDLGAINHLAVGGDGACWVRDGAEFLGGIYQLDRFHLRRALLRGLSGDVGLANEVYRACIDGDVALADSLLIQAQIQSPLSQRAAISDLRAYIIDNEIGLADYRLKVDIEGLRGLGAIEGNVDKLVASRMKKRGMSWTKKGAQRMARLIQLQQRGEILSWTKPPAKMTLPVKTQTQRKVRKHRDEAAWISVNMPALQGPHSSRPWVRVLKALAYGHDLYPRFRPTES